jgi:hypothetical protein
MGAKLQVFLQTRVPILTAWIRGGARNQSSPGLNKLINAWLLASFHSLSISKFHVALRCMRMTRAAAWARLRHWHGHPYFSIIYAFSVAALQLKSLILLEHIHVNYLCAK